MALYKCKYQVVVIIGMLTNMYTYYYHDMYHYTQNNTQHHTLFNPNQSNLNRVIIIPPWPNCCLMQAFQSHQHNTAIPVTTPITKALPNRLLNAAKHPHVWPANSSNQHQLTTLTTGHMALSVHSTQHTIQQIRFPDGQNSHHVHYQLLTIAKVTITC